ncbi:MAG: fibronectin type III domain-containing protein [Anaerolineae bacterium]|nr:fibronectin type III domain-containing protein [Anaerolineae bacterium]
MKKRYGHTLQKPVWLLLVFFLLVGAIVVSTAVAQGTPPPTPTFPIEHPDFPGVYIINREEIGNAVYETITIPIAQDTFIASGMPNTNYGGSTTLGLGFNSNSGQNAMRMFMQFNLAAIPANANVSDATFSMFQLQANNTSDNLCFRADFPTASWSENVLTWANAAGLAGQEIGVGCLDISNGWKTLNATQVINFWRTNTNWGAVFTGDERANVNFSRIFYSKEQLVNLGCNGPYGCFPYLTVTYNQQCDNQAPTASVSALPIWSQQYFTVSWSGFDTAPAGCTPSGIANYSVQYRINGGGWTDWQNFVTQTSASFGEAGNAQFVEFRVRARDNAGNVTDWSIIGPSASTTIDAVAPTATMNPLPEFSQAFGTISWGGSDPLPGSGIRSYDVQYRSNGGPWINLVTNAPASQTSYNYTGAPAGFYELRVRAVDNVSNIQPWSGPQASTTIVGHPVADMNSISPNIVTDPSATSVNISWTVFPFGYTITNIQIWVRQGTGNWTLWNTFGGSERNATFNFDPGDTVYQFEAVALSNTPSENEPRNSQPEASFIVDQEEPFVVPVAYMPLIAKEGN